MAREGGLQRVKHIILVLSGKGGVGKSSVTTMLALALYKAGKKVGVLDIDLCGPSIPRMFGLGDRSVTREKNGLVPVYADGSMERLGIMSIGFLLPNKDDAVIWRGPKKSAMIKQFLDEVCWGDVDYLLVDTPPGTSDEHISVMEHLTGVRPDGAIMVTTPQIVALNDVRREINFCAKVQLPILGLIENKSGFVCPHCADCTPIFGQGGGRKLSEDFGLDFLGAIPLDPELSFQLETNSALDLLDKVEGFVTFSNYAAVSDQILAKTSAQKLSR